MNKVCNNSDCTLKHHAKGYCEKHYRRLLKTGRTELISISERFWNSVVKTDSCWLWVGHRQPFGHGRFTVNGKGVLTHRYSYELLVGDIPRGLDLDHLCRNPPCVNPAHLEPVTHRENCIRGARVLNKKSGLPMGVYKIRNRYASSRVINGKKYYCGVFDTPEEAHEAYASMAD